MLLLLQCALAMLILAQPGLLLLLLYATVCILSMCSNTSCCAYLRSLLLILPFALLLLLLPLPASHVLCRGTAATAAAGCCAVTVLLKCSCPFQCLLPEHFCCLLPC